MKYSQDAIASIYDAAVNEKYWDIALDQCVTYTGARSASLVMTDNNPVYPVKLGCVSHVLRKDGGNLARFYAENLIHYERDGWEHYYLCLSEL